MLERQCQRENDNAAKVRSILQHASLSMPQDGYLILHVDRRGDPYPGIAKRCVIDLGLPVMALLKHPVIAKLVPEVDAGYLRTALRDLPRQQITATQEVPCLGMTVRYLPRWPGPYLDLRPGHVLHAFKITLAAAPPAEEPQWAPSLDEQRMWADHVWSTLQLQFNEYLTARDSGRETFTPRVIKGFDDGAMAGSVVELFQNRFRRMGKMLVDLGYENRDRFDQLAQAQALLDGDEDSSSDVPPSMWMAANPGAWLS